MTSILETQRFGAVIDPAAENPFKDKDGEGHIYRHPAPEAVQ